MTDPSRAHGQAIFALAEQAGYITYYGKVTDPDELLTYPYAVVWPPPGTRALTAMEGPAAMLTTLTQISVIGRNPDEVVAALDRIADRLVGVAPAIAGRNCQRIEDQSPGGPPEENPTLRTPDGQSTYRGVGIYQLVSTPTA